MISNIRRSLFIFGPMLAHGLAFTFYVCSFSDMDTQVRLCYANNDIFNLLPVCAVH